MAKKQEWGYKHAPKSESGRTTEHRAVWEQHYGKIPPGFLIHHKNGNKKDNRIENLQMVDKLTHTRIHSGCILLGGKWIKPCKKCGKYLPISAFYLYKGKPHCWCKVCFSKYVSSKKKPTGANEQ